jgi:hypothetical protein
MQDTEGTNMSTKTAPILEQTHTLIIDKQKEMKKKYRVTMNISDIIDVIITENIHMLEKYMGINVEKEDIDDDAKEQIEKLVKK